MPLPRSSPPSFSLISPEAVLLTGKMKRVLLLKQTSNKKSVGLTEKRAGRMAGIPV
jgi:hypothetical protein